MITERSFFCRLRFSFDLSEAPMLMTFTMRSSC